MSTKFSEKEREEIEKAKKSFLRLLNKVATFGYCGNQMESVALQELRESGIINFDPFDLAPKELCDPEEQTELYAKIDGQVSFQDYARSGMRVRRFGRVFF